MTSLVGRTVVRDGLNAVGNNTRRAPPYTANVLPGLNSSRLLWKPKLNWLNRSERGVQSAPVERMKYVDVKPALRKPSPEIGVFRGGPRHCRFMIPCTFNDEVPCQSTRPVG